MSKTARGYRSETQLDFETNYKTAPTTKAGKIMPINENSVQGTQSLKSTNTITGTRNDTEPYPGNEAVSGDVKVPNDLRAMGWWLRTVFGAPTTSVVTEGSLYKHIFKVQDDQPSYVLQKGFKDIAQYFIFGGCKTNSLSMPFGSDDESVATINVMGAMETLQTSAYDTTATEVKLNRLANAHASIKIGGSAIKIVKTGDMTIDCGLDGDQYCIGDNNQRGDLPEGIFKVSGNLTALFTDATFIEKAKAGTVDSLELIYTKDTQSLDFLFPEIMYERTSPAISGKTGVSCSMKWQGFYSADTNRSAAVVTLINDVASYA